ncbi:protein takeout-like [Anthonomus grandis grandis]|uniref:protein takeout-like n=1 Tax=Anthonomus grandis grandis TaxID=2921223 RepID=UPI0021656FAC|nr:protein takeout-like [Anthonomus grandis grandis]
MGWLVATCLLVSLIGFGESAKLPTTWGRCKRTDSAFPECIRKNLELAIRSMNKPTPELSLSTFDPLDIPELYIGEGKGPVNVAQNFKNVQLHGLTNAKVFKSNFDWDKKQLVTDSLNPELRLEADYNMKGRVLLLPIVGEGRCNVTLFNMKIHHIMSFDYIEKKGKTYIKVTDFKVTMAPERVEFKFDNLFNGQKDLGDNINKVLNENNKEVFDDVRPGYEKSFGLIFKDLANRVLHKVPVNDIFLD